ncbi:hypothetical protein [Oceanobacillus jeddahense]|uniref:YtxH domain-containing protein n=1 Tax=Oceanobacillus jeddahense TaxID=1462527 RepID=A0ABY5JWY7_9BACI|nr:hypothetical protein [Oceanobacillus jeddahense]UUI03367.1 hypothetical protein NP439_01210 [Oceanobacillus jeddahense]
MNNKGYKAGIVVSSVVGAALGWVASSYVEKKRNLEENPSLLTRLRDFEQRLYHDGFQKSTELQEIRQEVENKIAEEK